MIPLYEQWKKIAGERPNQVALRDIASGLSWTFTRLLAEGDAHPVADGVVACPQGQSVQFILTLLAAWRVGRVVCPLEWGQKLPEIASLPGDCGHLKLTSGTTAAARLIVFTEEQLAADAAQIVSAMGLRPDWPNLGVVSLAHSYGFSNLILPLLLHGIPLILVPAPLPEIVRRASLQEPTLTLAAVPAMWRAWHESGGVPRQVKLAISAGAPLPLSLEQSIFDGSGIKVHNFYGASECGGIAYDASNEPRTDASIAGSPMPHAHCSLNADGCLLVQGPSVGQTYFPDASPTLGGGKFQSSDLAEIKDGLVYLRGRAGDQINVAGRKVSPEAIERALVAHPAVKECVVFGIPDADTSRGEMIVALIVAAASENELKQYLIERLPSWQIPRRWRFVDRLPIGARGKISRAECRAEFKD